MVSYLSIANFDNIMTYYYSFNASNEDDTESEIMFRFQVPKLPDAVSETKFRYSKHKLHM